MGLCHICPACKKAGSLARTYTVRMITFEWDEAKSRTNLKKHGVSFEEARSVFLMSTQCSSSMKSTPLKKIASSCSI